MLLLSLLNHRHIRYIYSLLYYFTNWYSSYRVILLATNLPTVQKAYFSFCPQVYTRNFVKCFTETNIPLPISPSKKQRRPLLPPDPDLCTSGVSTGAFPFLGIAGAPAGFPDQSFLLTMTMSCQDAEVPQLKGELLALQVVKMPPPRPPRLLMTLSLRACALPCLAPTTPACLAASHSHLSYYVLICFPVYCWSSPECQLCGVGKATLGVYFAH